MVCVAASVAVLAWVLSPSAKPAVFLQVAGNVTNSMPERPNQVIYIAIVRMTNSSSTMVNYIGVFEEPFYESEVLKNGVWSDAGIFRCGFGAEDHVLAAKRSTEFKVFIIGAHLSHRVSVRYRRTSALRRLCQRLVPAVVGWFPKPLDHRTASIVVWEGN